MVQHELPVTSDGVPAPDAGTPGDAAAVTRSRTARYAISRGQLFMVLAIFLPAIASLLAPVFSGDVAYQIRTGQLIFETGSLIDTDPFTFTVAGEPWLNQQWGASVALALGYDTTGWLGLLLLRAVMIGFTFGLVFLACRGSGANSTVASLATLGAFAVAATNLALRSQTFGLLCFAIVVAILVYRRKHPLLLWLIPLVMLVWANTHGSFFVGWAAIGFAAIDDIAGRSRLAVSTVAVGVLSVLVTLLNPFGLSMWSYVVDLSTNPLIAELVSEWQPTTLKSTTGILFFGSVAFMVVLLLERGRPVNWLQTAWLGVLALVGLMAVRGVAWWAIGAAPMAALLLAGTRIRGRRLGDEELDRPRAVGYTAIVGVLVVMVIVALPLWRPIDPLYGPQGLVSHAPRGVTETLRAEARPGDRLFSDQNWASWFELAVPGLPVMVDYRIELFDADILGDYLAVNGGRPDWPDILDRWGVTLIATGSGQAQLRQFVHDGEDWRLLYEGADGVVYRRAEGSGAGSIAS